MAGKGVTAAAVLVVVWEEAVAVEAAAGWAGEGQAEPG